MNTTPKVSYDRIYALAWGDEQQKRAARGRPWRLFVLGADVGEVFPD